MVSWLRRWLPPTLLDRLGRLKLLSPELGVWGAWVHQSYCERRGLGSGQYRLRPRHARYPLGLRRGSSDPEVFEQIFIGLEYQPLSDLANVQLVIDCGANVGYSSAFFLSQFPTCRVIAVEPDLDNFAMLERNLSSYGERVKCLRRAIWSHDTPLALSRGGFRDGRDWSVQVRPCHTGEEGALQGMSIPSLLASSGFDRVSLLKIDIEGAEAVVFRSDLDWLDRVDALAIELHDDSQFGKATEVFHKAIDGRGFEVLRSGELTICRSPNA